MDHREPENPWKRQYAVGTKERRRKRRKLARASRKRNARQR